MIQLCLGGTLIDSLIVSPPVLFFFLGAIAAFVKSNLRVPRAITKLLSLYLLWAIGFRGGVELLHGGLNATVAISLGLAMLLAVIVPIYSFFVLRLRLTATDAAAMAATYGSISAVTFMTACTVLEQRGIEYGGHMVAAMALMESPAIVIGVLLLRLFPGDPAAPVAILKNHLKSRRRASNTDPRQGIPWGTLLHEAFLNGPVLLLLGSLAIGMLTGDRGYAAFKPLCTDLFNGVLVFFLLDLGLVAARRLRALKQAGWFVIAFGVVTPLLNAGLAIALARLGGLQQGDAILLAVLASSASYIAVPAAMRLVVPQANPGLYIPSSLAITFPFNIAIGIPLYIAAVKIFVP